MGSVNGEEGGIGEGFSEQLDRFEESLAEAGEEETVDDVAGEAKLSRRDSEDTMCSVVAGKVQLESYMYYKVEMPAGPYIWIVSLAVSVCHIIVAV